VTDGGRPAVLGNGTPQRRRHPRAVAALIFVGVAAMPFAGRSAVDVTEKWADGRPMLVIATDAGLPDEPYAWVRAEEGRADALLLVRWLRSCDLLQVVSLPRDTILDGSGEPASVVFGVAGADGLVSAVERTFDVDIFAVVTMSLADVAGLAGTIGPVEIDLRAESRDQRTGFVGGPGTVRLDGHRAVAFLRSRHWEEHGPDGWALTSGDDSTRIERLHSYLASAVGVIGDASFADRLRFAGAVQRRGEVAIRDHLAATGFVAGTTRMREVVFETVTVEPERTVDERRSPFSPARLGAVHRSVLGRGERRLFESPACSAPVLEAR
jgi:LytR_cpsA_psr family